MDDSFPKPGTGLLAERLRREQQETLTLLDGVGFRTKLARAAALVTWAADWRRYLGKVLWVVTDGAYAK